MADRLIGTRQPRHRGGLLAIVIAVIAILIGSRYIASTVIDYAWWSELHQVDTWLNLLLYGTVPVILATILFFVAFWIAFRAGMRHDAETPGLLRVTFVRRVALVALLLLAIFVANATVNNWTVVRYFGGLRLPAAATEYVDPIFGKPLHFYFFGLPFYNMLLSVLMVGAILSLLIYWATSHLGALSRRLPNVSNPLRFELEPISIRDAFAGNFVRLLLTIVLVGIAMKIFFGRYGLLLDDHGAYLVGVDWVADHLVIPLQWMMIAAAIAAALLVIARRARWALFLLLLLPIRYILPGLVATLYVRPNELNLERPYIGHHIQATRSAYALARRVTETTLAADPEIPIDYAKHKPLLDNVRLWDWRAFHDTLSQIQPLRPYVYVDTDIDRYNIEGQIRQVLLSPRELDIRQLGAASSRWVNTHLMYTHGYGIVMAEANRITTDGLPYLFIKNAPPELTTPSLRFTRPEIYYGEIAHEPVFVNTTQPEFNYPSGSQSVYTTYGGTGGFDISSLMLRLASAIRYSDINILITGSFTSKSRMMIHRPILDRLSTLAGFLTWDSDPYMVLTNSGKLMWIADGYMTSAAHPYSRALDIGNQSVNYIRNSVKATVDAYTGEANLYVFDPDDVLIQAYSRLFPNLFKPASAMPADIRAHARYPETFFSAQAEIYRTFHMRDPEAFYNRADLWDLARSATRQGEAPSPVSPTYVVATLPGENTPEFMLIIPFTPANKDNLIAYMAARCDGEHLGELVFEQLSKQNIIFGPIQIEARINQDQNISKDLTLWNQQGSQVLRGQMLVLPIDNSFLYVQPIYIQASQASMPQLKKVALAMGNRLAYADTYEQSLTELIQALGGAPSPTENQPEAAPQSAAAPIANVPSAQAVQTLEQIRAHLARYRELSAQGKWAEAGRELDEIQKLLQR